MKIDHIYWFFDLKFLSNNERKLTVLMRFTKKSSLYGFAKLDPQFFATPLPQNVWGQNGLQANKFKSITTHSFSHLYLCLLT